MSAITESVASFMAATMSAGSSLVVLTELEKARVAIILTGIDRTTVAEILTLTFLIKAFSLAPAIAENSWTSILSRKSFGRSKD